MGHALNHGLTTNAKGASWDQIRLKCTDGSGTLAIDEDCGAGLISSVTRTAQGIYTLQLSKPYPAKLVICTVNLSQAAETTGVLVVRYKRASYDATAGTFVVFVSNAAGTAAADPAQNDELHLDLVWRRYTANP